ncbi:MAG: bifunctional hydroxymethylpyrimidine kinase/phosphomethylpyrimidine kinase [Planctomycetota bacterium]|nr:bifunctional hydroxymethylpyrimidine kinase/phosphomethylpyrimidine kinase [Planctomycetota bacterium]
MRVALTIAGSDPSGGAGIQGDLKTFHAHGVYGMAVVTALTAQNTRGVTGVHVPPAEFLRRQLETVLDDMPVHAAKTGMLPDAAAIDAVVRVLAERPIRKLVVDPVMVATSGAALAEAGAPLQRLFPYAALITPNLPEAEALLGRRIATRDDMIRAARDLDARAVLLKGGHLAGDRVVDVLRVGREIQVFSGRRIDTPHTHGTGCALAASTAARFALGDDVYEAVASARAFVRRGIQAAVVLGQGNNPLNHLDAGA